MTYNYLNYYTSTYPTSRYDYYKMLSIFATALVDVLITVLLIALIILIIKTIAMWKLFNKAGEKGWKAIIPIYNMVILFKISGLSPWLVLVYLATFIPYVGWMAVVALNAFLAYQLAKSFGKDAGWAVGLYFLAPIFYMILAFGKSQYIGPNGEQTAVVADIHTETIEKEENK